MHALVNIALRAARDAAEALAHSSDRLDRVKIIDDHPDRFLTSMDRDADRTILYHLQKVYPSHGYFSRVSGPGGDLSSNTHWLIEPCLGNRNFASGYPQFGVSIACRINGIVSHGVIICPLLREEYRASRGDGAQLNSRRLRVDSGTELAATMIGLDPGHLAAKPLIALQEALMEIGAIPRISGDGSLDIVQASSGRLAGGWCAGKADTGLGAAHLILTEAGGLLGNEQGNPDLRGSSELVYGGPKIFKALIKLRQSLKSN